MFRDLKNLLPVLLLLAAANSAFAVCSGVYFKNTKTQQLSIPIANPIYVDMDSDGIKDLMGYNYNGPIHIVFYKGSANGFDTPPVLTNVGGGLPMFGKDAFADFNNDGKLDMIIGNNDSSPRKLTLYLNNGNGGFIPSVETEISGDLDVVRYLVDLNGDNRPDLVSGGVSWNEGVLYTRLTDANNHFGPATYLASGVKNVLVSDFNNDGKRDVVYTSNGNSSLTKKLYLLLNQGDGTFAQSDSHLVNEYLHYNDRTIAVDINNDGGMDVITPAYRDSDTPPYQYYFSVFQFDLKGHITETPVNITAALDRTYAQLAYYDNSPRAGDFDGDGATDLMFLSSNVGAVFVKHTGSLNFTAQRFSPVGDAMSLTTDLSGDTKADLISVNQAEIDQGYSLSVTFKQNVCDRQGQTKFVDFDGNGESDIGFWRPSDGRWLFYDQGQYTGFNGNINWGSGALGDIPVPQDYDGDGLTDFAVYRSSTGYWYIFRGSDAQVVILNFGLPGDKPVPADFDGDGRADIAVFRPSEGNWYYLPSDSPAKMVGVHWGMNGDVPLPMDYSGDGAADIAIFRPSNSAWYIWNGNDGTYTVKTFGESGQRPVPADYDNDGRADIAVWGLSSFGFGINWNILTSRNLYGLILGGNNGTPFAAVGTGSFGRYSALPAFYNPATSQIQIHSRPYFTYSGNSGNRNISWILPVE